MLNHDDQVLKADSPGGSNVRAQEEYEMAERAMNEKGRLQRISTIKKVIDYENEDVAADAWNFPIGWNRNVDPATGNAAEPNDPRFLSNEIQTAKYTTLNFVPYNLLH